MQSNKYIMSSLNIGESSFIASVGICFTSDITPLYCMFIDINNRYDISSGSLTFDLNL